MVQVIWLDDALHTVEAIRRYLRQFNPDAADSIALRLMEAGNSLQDFPERGRPAEDGFRELTSVPPYVLRYRVERGTVYISRIRHGRQQR